MKTSIRLGMLPWLCLGMFYATQAGAVPTKLGDLDDDNTHTANDLAKLVAHSSGAVLLSETLIPFADLNQDGAVNSTDQEELIKLILESSAPQTLPMAKVRQTSPYPDEGDVAVTRETVVNFTMPLSLTAAFDTTQFYADANGRRILSNVQIASDRRKATLFYSEPLPSNSRVRVVMEGAGVQDLLGRGMDLDGDGVAGGNLIFTFDTLSITALSGTGIAGRVLASERGEGGTDVPLAGVTIMVDGAEETLRTTTDVNGNFLLTPCPAGSFFVHVDGRTSPASAYPNGNYYPSVGKRWDAVASRLDNQSGNIQDTERGKIYLPLVEGAALVAVSATEETPVELPDDVVEDHPELEGTRLIVPPNSLFADDGTRGGRVAIAPVDPNRLPSPLPPGLELPMVITIQTDGGSNFDIPVPITFPNLPDPVTGDKLPPGAKTALWSFNHDLGDWEIVGPMTVSEDGEFVTTDAGVGVKQPGWHGTQQGSGGNGSPPRRRRPPPPEDPPCPDKSAWDYANLIYDVGKEAASCAIEFAKAKEALKCIFTLVDMTKNLLVGAANIGDALGQGENMQAVEHLMGIIEADLADTEALIGCAKVGSPFSRATAAFECVGNALNIADSLCQFTDDPSAADKCRPGFGARKFCEGIQLARALHTEIKVFVDLAKGLEEQAVLSGAIFAVKQVKFILESIRRKRAAQPAAPGAPPPPPPGEITFTPEEIAQIKAALGDMQKELLKLQELANNGRKLIQAMDKYQDQSDVMVSEVGKDLSQFGEPVQRSSYYRATIDGVVQRGRTAPSGGLSLIMAPDARYDLSLYDPISKEIGSTLGATGANGANIDLNAVAFQSTSGMLDDDNDGLVNQAESIIGTNPIDNDSDDDGILDGAEVQQGSDPLGGLIAQTGIIATVPQTAPAWHISTSNNLAVVSHRAEGISLYNIANPLTPSLTELYNTGGSAEAAVIIRNLVAVADNTALLILDASNPSAMVQRHSVTKNGASFVSVATDGVMVYAGSNNGKVYAIDLASGSILGEISLADAGTVYDLAVWRGRLYALQSNKLSTINLDTLTATGTLTVTGGIGAGGRIPHLFAGDGTLYATYMSGFNIVDTATTPDTPTLVSTFQPSPQQYGWKQIVGTGNGLGVAAVSANSTDDGPHEIDLFTLGANERTPVYNTTFITPGLAAGLSLYNGLAYVADSASGLQVLSFKPFDSLGLAPSISITANIPLNSGNSTGEIESGKPVRVYSTATDDVLVRNVEFYVDGTLKEVDGTYPFEGGFNAPLRSPSKTSFTLRAKVSDTGGNSTWSPLYTIALIPDLVPPLVKRTYPSSIGGLVKTILGIFNEPLDPATITASSVQLTFAGPDGILDSGGDDSSVTAQSIVYREDINAVSFNVADILPQGLYRGKLTTAIKDASGNALAADHVWTFSTNNSSSIFIAAADGNYNWSDAANWSTGTVPGAGSTVIIDAGPGIRINLGNASLDGVALSVQGGAKLVLQGNNATLHNVTLNGDLHLEGNAYLTVTGGLTFDNGRLIMTSSNGTQTVNVPNNISFTGTGEILMGSASTAYLQVYDGMILGAGITTRLRGNAYLGYYYYYSSNPVINLGTIITETPTVDAYLYSVDNQGTFTVNQGNVSTVYNYVNHGTMNLGGTGELRVYRPNSNTTGFGFLGTINRNGGTLTLYDTFDLNGGTLALTAATGSWNLEYATIKNGTITTSGGAALTVAEGGYYATLENIDLQGTVNVPQGSYLYLKGAWQNHGVINLDKSYLYVEGSFLLSQMGTINQTGESQVRITGEINNTGLTLDPGSLPSSYVLYDGTIKGGSVGHAGPSPIIMPDGARWRFDGVTVTSNIKVGYGCSLDVLNGLTLNNVSIYGQSDTQPNDSYLNIDFIGGQTVGGTGSIVFDTPGVTYSTLYLQVTPTYDNLTGNYIQSPVTFAPTITTRFKSGYIYVTSSHTEFIHQGTLHCSADGDVTLYGRVNNTGTINIPAGKLNLTSYGTETWTNAGVINLSGMGELDMGGEFTLAQLGVVNRTGGTQVLVGTLNLTPTGTLALNATTGSWEMAGSGVVKGGVITTTGGSKLVIQSGQYGQLDGSTLQGTLDVNDGTLTMKGDWINQGIINVTDGVINWGGEYVIADLGTVNAVNSEMFITGILNNTSTTFQLDNPFLKLGNEGTIKGGTITASSAEHVLNNGYYNTQTLDGVTLASDFKIRGQVYIKNGLTINAGVTLHAVGVYLRVSGSQTFGGGGTLAVDSQDYYGNYIYVDRALEEGQYLVPANLTFGPNFTVLAHEDIYMDTTSYGDDKIINQGLIRCDTNGAVIDIRRPFQNDGQVQEANGGVVYIHD
ncbi:MAG: Ig-like domain-containing protein [Verrucomicrobiota bacterium]